MTSERAIQNAIRLALSKIRGATFWRNNTGQAWAGRATKITRPTTVDLAPGDVVIRQARPVQFGLCVGSSDLIGLRTVLITPDLVGTQIAQFCASEVKTPRGRPTQAQLQFLDFINDVGGVAGVVRSVDEAVELITSRTTQSTPKN